MSGWQALAVRIRLTLCRSTGLGWHRNNPEDLPVLNNAAPASATLTGLPRTSTQAPSLVTDFSKEEEETNRVKGLPKQEPRQEETSQPF